VEDILQHLVRQGIALHKQGKFDEAALIYNRVLNRDPFNEDLLFLLGDLYLRKDFSALGIHLLSALLQKNPKHAAAWCNMGVGYRKENDYTKARECWEKAIEVGGETPESCNNLAGLYADRAMPEVALRWLKKSLTLRPDDIEGNWLKALALLTLGRWDEGWKQYGWRQKLPNWESRKTAEAPLWDGKPVDHLYIHGEQGIGDEVMFASAIPLAIPYAKRITLEVNAKVAGIAKQTWPDFKVVKEELAGKYDAKIPIGSLIGMFGMNPKPYLEPHPEKVAFYRRELEKFGPGPYIALTWHGGTKATRVEDRTLGLDVLKPIMDAFTCVSAQYAANPIVEQQRKEAGLFKINEESAGEDMHDQAALFKAVDAVVTVQQTAVHVAGGVGAKTFALIGDRPHWRYGISGDFMPFYSSVKLLRKKTDWAEVVQRTLKELHADFGSVQRTKQGIA
jgi:hypothetical protein